MGVYATPAEVRAFCVDSGVRVSEIDENVERLIARAEIDVDLVVGPWPRFSNGRKFDPSSLSVTARAALSRATCAQVESSCRWASTSWWALRTTSPRSGPSPSVPALCRVSARGSWRSWWAMG